MCRYYRLLIIEHAGASVGSVAGGGRYDNLVGMFGTASCFTCNQTCMHEYTHTHRHTDIHTYICICLFRVFLASCRCCALNAS